MRPLWLRWATARDRRSRAFKRSWPSSAVWVSTAAEGDAVAPIHVAFQAADNDAVKAFYEAGLANGGTDNGQPGPRPNYGPTYYAAFVHDPEGNNIEAMLA